MAHFNYYILKEHDHDHEKDRTHNGEPTANEGHENRAEASLGADVVGIS